MAENMCGYGGFPNSTLHVQNGNDWASFDLMFVRQLTLLVLNDERYLATNTNRQASFKRAD